MRDSGAPKKRETRRVLASRGSRAFFKSFFFCPRRSFLLPFIECVRDEVRRSVGAARTASHHFLYDVSLEARVQWALCEEGRTASRRRAADRRLADLARSQCSGNAKAMAKGTERIRLACRPRSLPARQALNAQGRRHAEPPRSDATRRQATLLSRSHAERTARISLASSSCAASESLCVSARVKSALAVGCASRMSGAVLARPTNLQTREREPRRDASSPRLALHHS